MVKTRRTCNLKTLRGSFIKTRGREGIETPTNDAAQQAPAPPPPPPTPTHPHPHTHTHTHTRTPRTGPKQTHPEREAKQKAEEQVPPGQGHQRKSLDIQSPSAVTIAVPAPMTGSHPKKVSEETGGSDSKSRVSESSGTTSSSRKEEL